MSEWQAIVYCTCFQSGLTREPPLPRAELRVNRFGVVTLVGGTDHAEDPDELWCWRVGMSIDGDGDDAPQPCRHESMLEADEIFYWPGARAHAIRYPDAEDAIVAGDFPVLRELVYRPEGNDYASGGIWIHPTEAVAALAETRRLGGMLEDIESPDGALVFVDVLEILLGASVATRNPVIVHYNGVIDGAWP